MDKDSSNYANQVEEYVMPLIENITSEKLLLVRNLSFAGAGVSVAFLIAMLSLEHDSILLKIAILAFSVAIPFFLAGAGVAENHIWAGPQSYKHYLKWMLSPISLKMIFTSYLALGVGVTSVLLHLDYLTGVVFFVFSVIAYRIHAGVQRRLTIYIKNGHEDA